MINTAAIPGGMSDTLSMEISLLSDTAISSSLLSISETPLLYNYPPPVFFAWGSTTYISWDGLRPIRANDYARRY